MARILVVDDDRVILAAVEDWLTFEKHDVTAVNSGRKGRQQLQADTYDLVILDWDMPDITGPDILKEFRDAGGTTPVILLTGHTSIDDKAYGLDAGADDYITKPFHVKELSARIRTALRHQRAPEAAPPALGQGNDELLRSADLIGTKLAASYEFLEEIGQGGSALVFKARHPRLDRLVAIKVLRWGGVKDSAIERFEREARAVSRINHYNVITIHDSGVTERNRPFIVMEYIEGESLVDKIIREGPQPLHTAATILLQLCSGMEEVHAEGIIHRDLKPTNILLKKRSNRADWVKIVDFGLVHLLEGRQERLTEMGRVMGTPRFVSPERLTGKPADVRSDIYSMGVIMFELLTARPLFEADTTEDLLLKAVSTAPDPPSLFREDIPPGSALDNLVVRATERDPNKRYQTVTEMREEVERILYQLPREPRPQ